MTILKYVIIALAGAVPGQAEFKSNEFRVCVKVRANIYTYQVTNLSTSPIVRFALKQHATYNFTAPKGWQTEIISGVFQAWTDKWETGISPNESGEFSLRVSSSGAVLGSTTAKVTFQSGQTASIREVWAPAGEPKSYFWLVAGVMLSIMLLHTAVGAGRRRARKACSKAI